MWCHKAEITMVAESGGPLLSKNNFKSPSGDRAVLSMQSGGPCSCAKPWEDELGPRSTRDAALWPETSQAGDHSSGLGIPHP